jgi:hypothetical protein
MSKLTVPTLALAALVVVLAGCGGGGSTGSSSGGGVTSTSGAGGGTGAVDGVTVGNCLNEDENFLVQPNGNKVDGQSPAGVSFTLTFYATPAAAQAAIPKSAAKTSAVVENGVVDFHGNPSPYEGAPPAKISKVELAAIKRCIDTAKGK